MCSRLKHACRRTAECAFIGRRRSRWCKRGRRRHLSCIDRRRRPPRLCRTPAGRGGSAAAADVKWKTETCSCSSAADWVSCCFGAEAWVLGGGGLCWCCYAAAAVVQLATRRRRPRGLWRKAGGVRRGGAARLWHCGLAAAAGVSGACAAAAVIKWATHEGHHTFTLDRTGRGQGVAPSHDAREGRCCESTTTLAFDGAHRRARGAQRSPRRVCAGL